MKKALGVALLLFASGKSAIACAEAIKSEVRVSEDELGIATSKCDAVAGNLVRNCGFETGNFPPWIRRSPPCFCSITAESRFSGAWGFENGNPTLDELWQSLETVPGQQYSLTFLLRNVGVADPIPRAMFGYCNDGPTVLQSNLFRVHWEGVVVYELTDAPQLPWISFQIDGLFAARAFAQLKFGFCNPVEWWHLDDVVVVPCSK